VYESCSLFCTRMSSSSTFPHPELILASSIKGCPPNVLPTMISIEANRKYEWFNSDAQSLLKVLITGKYFTGLSALVQSDFAIPSLWAGSWIFNGYIVTRNGGGLVEIWGEIFSLGWLRILGFRIALHGISFILIPWSSKLSESWSTRHAWLSKMKRASIY